MQPTRPAPETRCPESSWARRWEGRFPPTEPCPAGKGSGSACREQGPVLGSRGPWPAPRLICLSRVSCSSPSAHVRCWLSRCCEGHASPGPLAPGGGLPRRPGRARARAESRHAVPGAAHICFQDPEKEASHAGRGSISFPVRPPMLGAPGVPSSCPGARPPPQGPGRGLGSPALRLHPDGLTVRPAAAPTHHALWKWARRSP